MSRDPAPAVAPRFERARTAVELVAAAAVAVSQVAAAVTAVAALTSVRRRSRRCR